MGGKDCGVRLKEISLLLDANTRTHEVVLLTHDESRLGIQLACADMLAALGTLLVVKPF